ncbi:MAG: hypothetical protein KAV83_08495 [Desulfobacterales bacterium]|nr:hypothetical protein [Desulfobacterales bacterium]
MPRSASMPSSVWATFLRGFWPKEMTDLIVNLKEGQKDREPEKDRLWKIIEKTFLTDTGKRLAREALLRAEQ